tara:strand:- start:2424 stop:4505 length:2082 start_codon:yes stop_codon:yes gene_type:complete
MFHSIRYKFIIITTLSIIVSASLVFFLAINKHEDLYRQSVEENLDALSSNIADNLLWVMSDKVDSFSITTELLGLDRYEHIKFVNVFDTNWQLIQYYVHPNYLNLINFKPELVTLTPQSLPRGVAATTEGLVALKTIGEERSPLGYLLIVQDYEKPLKQSKVSLFYNTVPFVVMVIAFAILISIWIYQLLFTPLLQLSKFTQKVAKTANYNLKYTALGNDEVSLLGDDINNLLKTIDAQIKTNKKHTVKLLEQQQSMQRLVNYDILTGLPNRMYFLQLLKNELILSKQAGEDIALMFFDIDSFKGINDTLGHEIGDLLLQAVAKQVTSHLRDNDVIARLGGDEFLIMLPNIADKHTAITIAERILAGLEKPFKLNNWDVPCGVSIGIASAQDADYDMNTFIFNADIAMYASKQHGKGSYTIFNKAMLENNKRRIEIANLIDRAITEDEFNILYQLKISASGKVTGLEALIRWQSSELGFISPEEFIAIAEQAGKIKAITKWVITRVFNDLPVLQQKIADDVLVSINISSHDLHERNFIHLIKSKLAKYNVDIRNIQFEITESSYLENFTRANEFFRNISEMGGSIALDDFGTGYSSLSYLTKIEIDTLKIDRMFINQYACSGRDTAVLQTMLDLAKRLELKICCEGIETIAQANYLLANGADEMQGYYFAKPVAISVLPIAIAQAEKLFTQLR